MPIQFFEIKTDEDIKRYLQWLIDNKCTYHFDDSIDDVCFGPDVTEEQLDFMREMSKRLDQHCDIWVWFELNDDMYEKYKGI